jgi:5'-nucleotidase
MRILVSNDDGIDAPGISALADALAPLGEVYVVAPASEQSARSHALTMHEPLRVVPRGPRRWAVSGTPADAVYVAVHHLLPGPPDLVCSGVNRGPNLGDDTWYSGTVAAAREGAMHDLPALAVSLGLRPEVGDAERHYAVAAALAADVARRYTAARLPPRTVLNLNVPDRPAAALGALRLCPLSDRHYRPTVHENRDPRGRSYFWIGGVHEGFSEQPETDGWWFERGHPTLTPLHMVTTDHALLERLRGEGPGA